MKEADPGPKPSGISTLKEAFRQQEFAWLASVLFFFLFSAPLFFEFKHEARLGIYLFMFIGWGAGIVTIYFRSRRS